MLHTARRSSAVLRSLRAASFSPSSTILKPLRTSRSTFYVEKVSGFSKPFSSALTRFSSNAAAQEIAQQDESKEFTKFEELAEQGTISRSVVDTITQRMDIHTMTDVQRMTLNSCLDGSDVIAQARTGTGKTLAFLLPIVQRILKDPKIEHADFRRRASVDIRALIVSPTRELAEQIATEAGRLCSRTGIKVQTAVGGTGKSYHLRKMQNEGCHLLIGTPGRINDLLQDRNSGVSMENIETFVLDEADRLLDIGFAPAIEEMQSYMPNRGEKPRQTLMFSATVPKTVVSLVRQTMRPDFKFVRTIDPDEAPTHERIPQRVVFMNGLQNQIPTILEIAMNAIDAHKKDPANNLPFKAIVYFGATTQVDFAYNVFNNLRDPARPAGGWADSRSHPLSPCRIFRMNGQLSQQQRSRETQGFRNAESAILISTDVTARGMDFPNVSHVIQLGLPRNPDDYIHRLGRTGRAGKPGEGWLLLNEDEKKDLARSFRHKGVRIESKSLETASLDMTRGAQLSPQIAKLLQMVEIGVKTVPFSIKSDVYKSLLGVMQQQFPGRPKQDQIDMMNDLAKFGWGMQTPPPLPRTLVEKLGYSRCSGIEIDERQPRNDFGGSRSRSFGSQRRNAFDERDPFGFGSNGNGKGVFRPDSDRDERRGFGSGHRNDRNGRNGRNGPGRRDAFSDSF